MSVILITLRSHEASVLDDAVKVLSAALLAEEKQGVWFAVAPARAEGVGADRMVGADFTVFDNTDSIGRHQFLTRLEKVDFTKNVDVHVRLP